jgi:hypothetical protein
MSIVPEPEGTTPPGLPLIAYRLRDTTMRVAPASAHRSWMARTNHQFASRCLPLLLANQAGWHVFNDHAVSIEWDGGPNPANLQIRYGESTPEHSAVSQFGHGILTWRLPFVFRSPPGFNLLVRGPANLPKDGAQALEGLVEADWSNATFTMNWQLTRPGLAVTFEADEPIALLVPQRRAELASFAPEVRPVEDAPEVATGYRIWHDSRQTFLRAQQAGLVRPTEWQKHYFRGRLPGGETAIEHEVRLRLRDFEPVDTD